MDKRANILGTWFLVGMFAASCIFILPNAARATPIELTVTGVKDSRSVSIAFPNLGTQRVKAGEYQMYIVGDPYTGAYGGFCIEDVWAPSRVQKYYLTDVTGEDYLRAAWIADRYFAGMYEAALAQVAIWEVVLETDSDYIVDAGQLSYVSGFNADEIEDVQNIVDDAIAADLSGFTASAFKLAVNPVPDLSSNSNYQDYLVKIPEPAAMLLLGIGLISVAGFSRKKLFKK